ncbi:hypothetical protein [uncultured Methylobacterium sp.]|uniref:hypothetical protein n=1 Tax=uncultured Methylobacterium sp. TaxID=157278 RepID=UPI0035CC99FC
MTAKKSSAPSAKAKPPAVRPQTEKSTLSDLGGASSNRWNAYLMAMLVAAVPDGDDPNQREGVTKTIVAGQRAMNVADPVEGMISAQMIAANTAALSLYRRAFIPEQNFEVRTKYLALADKAARTVALLTDTLDRHRSRGEQRITVRHVTVNADQAVVLDQFVSGSGSDGKG